jgi:hypothetical protein
MRKSGLGFISIGIACIGLLSCNINFQNPFLQKETPNMGSFSMHGTVVGENVDFSVDTAWVYIENDYVVNKDFIYIERQSPLNRIGFGPFDKLASGTTYTVLISGSTLQEEELHFMLSSHILSEQEGYRDEYHPNEGTITITKKTDNRIEGTYDVVKDNFDINGEFSFDLR